MPVVEAPPETKQCDALVIMDDEIFTGPDTWIQGATFRNGSYCLIGGIEKACGLMAERGCINASERQQMQERVTTEFIKAISETYEPGLVLEHEITIPGWNDTKGRTFRDIRHVVRRVRYLLCGPSSSEFG